MTRILVFGAAGMAGHAIFRLMSESFETFGTIRSPAALKHFPEHLRANIDTHVDSSDIDSVALAIQRRRPDVVVNGIGLIKQLQESGDPLTALPVNALFPHRLANLCALAGARLVHLSTDCVFDGRKGNYTEDDPPTATDVYGLSKLLGEVSRPGAITLRTSIIGHELGSRHGLVEWFLGSEGSVSGYTKAIFSGVPTVELAEIIRDFVIPNPQLSGLFQVSVAPIDKHRLLQLVAAEYGKAIEIVADDKVNIDRSLDSRRFRDATGYRPPTWPELIRKMKAARP